MELVVQAARPLAFALLLLGCLHCCRRALGRAGVAERTAATVLGCLAQRWCLCAPRLTPCSALPPPACSLLSAPSSAAERETNWSRQRCDASLSSLSGPAATARVLHALWMGQRLSTSSTMATNVEKTEGEEKTFVCAVSTGS